MGDWVAHPSNIAARRILVTYPLLTVVSGEGSPEPPGIRMNKPTESLLQLFHHTWLPFAFLFSSRRRDFLRDMFPPSLYLSLVFTCKMRKQPESGWSISHYFSFKMSIINESFCLANQN
jgi:hypothetical protein